MDSGQQISPVRRRYNRWVANQTLEDYSLRFTAKSARIWSEKRVAITAMGAISFLALEAIGGSLTLHYGFINTFAAIWSACIIIFLLGIPICYHAARNGIDIDLLTRGAGFGYIGSTITSLIYASFTFIFFALEAAIMSMALELTLNIPLSIGYVISSIVVIPLVTHGITFISRFQLWTQPIWMVLQLLPLACIVYSDMDLLREWTQYEVSATSGGTFNVLYFGLASSVVFSLVAQIGEQVDFLRFLPEQKNNPKKWTIAMLAAGPGWVVIGLLKLFIGSFLAWLAFSRGLPTAEADDPTTMYQVAFSYLTTSPNGILVLVGVFIILSQLKINVTNAYAGSIAWSNFFSRITRNHPGRVVWLVFNVVIALLLMELGIYRVLEDTLAIYAIIALAWVGSLVADLVISRSLGLRPAEISFKRADLYDINPVGVGSMSISTVLGLSAYMGLFGELMAALSCYLTLLATLILAPLFAWLTGGKYYTAQKNNTMIFREASNTCCICELDFESEDMSFCPAYSNSICSLCCSLDMRCDDVCKTGSRYTEQFQRLSRSILPSSIEKHLSSNIGNFIGMMLLSCVIIFCLLLLIYYQVILDVDVNQIAIKHALWKVSFLLLIVAGVVSWVLVLLQDSHRLARDETKRQTGLLKDEIEAHTNTDKALQDAKEIAEAANQAKSRYLTGISHELRSPLNSLLGYAQLLEKDSTLSEQNIERITVIRHSGEYLSDLIEGLLDISKIEAGRLDIARKEIQFSALLDQIVNMFSIQAAKKKIEFIYECTSSLPEYVNADEKHLRQILINLLSNAIKFTQTGNVKFAVTYRSEIATFTITDTGSGIAEEDYERIFSPFQRVRKPHLPDVPGTGLGLTITKLLTDIMGGDISLTSEEGKGSEFRVQLMMSSVVEPKIIPVSDHEVLGYTGERITVMVVDDDATHRRLISDTLNPLGFTVLKASHGLECIEKIKQLTPDLFILDVSMPGMTGWELAAHLRNNNYRQAIIMLSADAGEGITHDSENRLHNAYIVKPIKISALLEKIGAYLDIDWKTKSFISESAAVAVESISRDDFPSDTDLLILKSLADVGYKRGLSEKLDQMEKNQSGSLIFITHLRKLVKQYQFTQISNFLGESE